MADKNVTPGELKEVTNKYARRQITRREFLTRTAALGLSLPAVSALLAACGAEPEVIEVEKEVVVTREVAVEKEVEKIVTQVVEAEPKEISGHVTFCYDGWGGAAWDEIFDKFHEELPGIDLEVVLVNGDEMADKSITMCAAGQMTWDIVVWGGRRQDHIDGGYILPINGIVRKELIDDLTDIYKEVMTSRGLLWTLPWYQHYGQSILFNRGMWEQGGQEEGPVITWPEFADQMYKLRDSGVVKHPMGLSGMQNFDSTKTFDTIVKAFGGYWFEPWDDPNSITPAFVSNDRNLKATEWVVKLIQDEIIHPASMNFEAAGIIDLFNGGEIATLLSVYYHSAKALDPSQSKVVDQVDCALIPGTDGQTTGGTFASGQAYYLYTQAQERDFEASVAAYEFLAGPWANSVWAEKAALGPAYKSIQDDPKVLLGLPFMDVWAEQGRHSLVKETNPQWEKPFAGLGIITEWRKNQETYLSALYTGSMDGQTMWKKLEEDYLKLEERAIKEGRRHDV
jgi:ABC-type glycerol-3-phosphate transport system substrate-binding protein